MDKINTETIFQILSLFKKKKQRPVGLERHKGEKLWQILFITIVYLTQQVE